MSPEPAFVRDLAPLLRHWGYPGVAAAVMLEDFGIPVPGETILIAAAVLSGAGELNLAAVMLAAVAGAIIGDNIGFLIGHHGGRPLVLRWGRYVFLTPERLAATTRFFERHGGKVVLVARFVEGLRQLNGIVAGISRMPWRRFAAFNAAGAVLWVGFWAGLAYLAGSRLEQLIGLARRFEIGAAVLVLVLLAVYAAVRWRRAATRPARPPSA